MADQPGTHGGIPEDAEEMEERRRMWFVNHADPSELRTVLAYLVGARPTEFDRATQWLARLAWDEREWIPYDQRDVPLQF